MHNTAQKVTHLVCYDAASQKQDCSVVVTPAFKFTILPGSANYCAFYDDKQQYWAVQTASADQVEALARNVALVSHAHWAAHEPEGSQPLIMQDLVPTPADMGPVAKGDHIKMRYTMHLLGDDHPQALGPLVGSVGKDKAKRSKVGDGKSLKGIEAGVLGMTKGMVRFLVIPPSLGYGEAAAGSIPAHSTLLVELSVIAVKGKDGP